MWGHSMSRSWDYACEYVSHRARTGRREPHLEPSVEEEWRTVHADLVRSFEAEYGVDFEEWVSFSIAQGWIEPLNPITTGD